VLRKASFSLTAAASTGWFIDLTVVARQLSHGYSQVRGATHPVENQSNNIDAMAVWGGHIWWRKLRRGSALALRDVIAERTLALV
jgi:hypothetical protein